MDKEAIVPFDWQRVLWGEDPLGFYGEIVFRTVIMYVVLLALLRLLSKRTLTQLSVLEFGIVIALGSAAGDPTFYKDIPLMHGLLVLGVVVGVQLIYTWLTRNFEAAETVLQGHTVELVREGRILVAGLKKGRLSHEELFELLRQAEVRQLGEVEHAYLEQNGQISVLKYEEAGPGLCLIPPWDLEKPEPVLSGSRADPDCWMACMCCGHSDCYPDVLPLCAQCGHDRHTPAKLLPKAVSPRKSSS